ncbi:MAG: hypothetical protein ACRDQX_16245, partial [Pseudonocardiaceae bacterium]
VPGEPFLCCGKPVTLSLECRERRSIRIGGRAATFEVCYPSFHVLASPGDFRMELGPLTGFGGG